MMPSLCGILIEELITNEETIPCTLANRFLYMYQSSSRLEEKHQQTTRQQQHPTITPRVNYTEHLQYSISLIILQEIQPQTKWHKQSVSVPSKLSPSGSIFKEPCLKLSTSSKMPAEKASKFSDFPKSGSLGTHGKLSYSNFYSPMQLTI